MLHIDILTTFPEMFAGPFDESIVKRAQEGNVLSLRPVNIRDLTDDTHRTTDDAPFGGGDGMVMMAPPILKAVSWCRETLPDAEPVKVIILSPQGQRFTQSMACQLAEERHLILICGHYKGVDDRVRILTGAEEVSIGDYVLTGGELPAMVIVDCVARLLPGAVNSFGSVISDSFYRGLLEPPVYTRPREVESLGVPDVLLSGNHQAIETWRREMALRVTAAKRPDLLAAWQAAQEGSAQRPEAGSAAGAGG